jgi:hypothetical protein
MASPVASPATTLHIRRVFNAPRERLFQAWTDPKKMTEWFCHAKPELVGQLVAMDVRPGGRYGFDISGADGKVFRVRGEYVEINVPEKLVFTWYCLISSLLSPRSTNSSFTSVLPYSGSVSHDARALRELRGTR